MSINKGNIYKEKIVAHTCLLAPAVFLNDPVQHIVLLHDSPKSKGAPHIMVLSSLTSMVSFVDRHCKFRIISNI
jgi:hypothetical protein